MPIPKRKTVTAYQCRFCKRQSEDEPRIIECEAAHEEIARLQAGTKVVHRRSLGHGYTTTLTGSVVETDVNGQRVLLETDDHERRWVWHYALE